MSMPKTSENKYRPDVKCVLIDLLESIAMEEMALSHLLNAEAEKIQAFVGEKEDFPYACSFDDIIEFNRKTLDFMDKIIMKEWLLLNKLKQVKEVDCFHFPSGGRKTKREDEDNDSNQINRPLKKVS